VTYLAVPEDTVFLKPDEAYDMVRLLRHVIKRCETTDVEDYPMPLTLASLRGLLTRLD
jgi:hypothetical protein